MTNHTEADLDKIDAEIALASGWTKRLPTAMSGYNWEHFLSPDGEIHMQPPQFTRKIQDLWPLVLEMNTGQTLGEFAKSLGNPQLTEYELHIALALAVLEWLKEGK